MEFALSENNERIVASPGAKGFCSLCGEFLIPKCGKIRIHHWAHKTREDCDPWWEGETDWHRQWKNFVEEKFREITIIKDGIKHRADVQLPSPSEIIFEFQRKPLSIDERQERENFYVKMIWVIHFSKDKILEITERKMYLPMFGDSYVKVKSFSEGFFRPLHPCPIFLDFDDGEMFWIREFDDYDNMRARWFYGRFIRKIDFINQYLKNPSFSDIDELKISHHHRDYEAKQKQLWAVRAELSDVMEELRIAKQQKYFDEHFEELQKINEELRKKDEEETQKRQYEKDTRKRQNEADARKRQSDKDEAKKRQEIMNGFNKTINAYTELKKEDFC
ncbi:MAG: competence protein CoiA family protein [Methanoregula sp.]